MDVIGWLKVERQTGTGDLIIHVFHLFIYFIIFFCVIRNDKTEKKKSKEKIVSGRRESGIA